jgi:carbonic anhydrase/acetyltransferase-like protein (isoleucine patch superfamily)
VVEAGSAVEQQQRRPVDHLLVGRQQRAPGNIEEEPDPATDVDPHR